MDADFDSLIAELRKSLPTATINVADAMVTLPSPCTDILELRVAFLDDQVVVELGDLFHTHFYGCEAEADSNTIESRRARISETVAFVRDFLNEELVLAVSSGGSATLCSIDAPIEYDHDEEYWPNGRPADLRIKWSGRVAN